jgi:allophanate hydrolase
VTLAIAGGGFIVEAAGGPLGSWHILTLREGERLVIRPGPWGSWCYIAFAGALRTGAWLGSASTHALSGLGGGVIRTGQELEIAEAQIRPVLEGPIPCPVIARPRHTARVVLGPQDRFFGAEALEAFLSARYTLSDAYDRMGVRLSGPALVPEAALGIPSEAILRGSVQVAGDGVPVLLLADHQTTGGYPKIATAVDGDLDGFAQLRPGDPVRFRAVLPAEAVALARGRARAQAAYLAALARKLAGPAG